MSQKFAVFDIDGTLVRWQLYHAVVDDLVERGYIDAAKFSKIHDARMEWKKRSHPEAFKAYEEQLVDLYKQAVTGISVEHFQQVAKDVFNEYKDQVYTYTRSLLNKLKGEGYLLFAISGSQTEIVRLIAQYYGFDDYAGTTFLQENGVFTGKFEAVLGAKDLVLKSMASKHEASYKDSVGVGDSMGDISMLEVVERPIAFNPEKKLYDRATKLGWKIVIERKNMVYELEASDGKYQLA